MPDCFVWNPDPEIFRIGPLAIRYYSLLFVAGLLLGFRFWMSQSKRLGYDLVVADKWLVWGVVAVVAGSRLGHCLFYEPLYYLKHPLEILFVWKGGLASHGATLGIIFTLWLYSRKYRIPYIEVLDRMAIPTTMGATFVRLGNFMNSEIVGRVSDAPWAVCFPRYDDHGAHARHPSQLYEAGLGFAIFGVVLLVDRLLPDNGRKRGILFGLFMSLYFTGRFVVEFFKEYQALSPDQSWLTEGQYLSIPFAVVGYIWLALALRGTFGRLKVPACDTPTPVPVPARRKKRG
jgi:prolipoprotein diacylglyceryl transferase